MLNNNGRRGFTMKAVEDCDLLTLNKVDLAKVDAEYEDIVALMFKNAKMRLKKTLRIKDESENLILKKEVSHLSIYNYDTTNKVRRLSTSMPVKRMQTTYQLESVLVGT